MDHQIHRDSAWMRALMHVNEAASRMQELAAAGLSSRLETFRVMQWFEQRGQQAKVEQAFNGRPMRVVADLKEATEEYERRLSAFLGERRGDSEDQLAFFARADRIFLQGVDAVLATQRRNRVCLAEQTSCDSNG